MKNLSLASMFSEASTQSCTIIFADVARTCTFLMAYLNKQTHDFICERTEPKIQYRTRRVLRICPKWGVAAHIERERERERSRKSSGSCKKVMRSNLAHPYTQNMSGHSRTEILSGVKIVSNG
jgi:hypothetical protein